jgi:hypothetical protein
MKVSDFHLLKRSKLSYGRMKQRGMGKTVLIRILFRPFALMQKDQKIKAVRPRTKKGSCCLNCANSRGVCCAFVVKGVLRSNSAQFLTSASSFFLTSDSSRPLVLCRFVRWGNYRISIFEGTGGYGSETARVEIKRTC